MQSAPWLGRGSLLTGGLLVVVVTGVVGYLLLGYDAAAAVAMTLLTLTTVGFATNHDLPSGVELFTAILAVLGVGLFAAILGVAGTAIVEGRVGALSRSRRMHRRIDQLHDHFIVCAYGRVGRSIARELETAGTQFVVIDSKVELEQDMQRDGVPYLLGTASSEQILREAGIDRARGLICAVDSDAENVYITVVARSLSPHLRIVARAAQEQSADRLVRAGATHVVSPYVTSGRRMAALALHPHIVEFFDIARAGQPALRLEELAVTAESPLVGRALSELTGQAVPLLVRRGSGELIANPGRQLELREGDVVVLYGEAQTLRPLDAE